MRKICFRQKIITKTDKILVEPVDSKNNMEARETNKSLILSNSKNYDDDEVNPFEARQICNCFPIILQNN